MAVTATEGAGAPKRGRRHTTLDNDVTRPSTVEAGDPPFADTTDPNERATSVSPDKAAAALAGFGTVNAVVPLPQVERDEQDKADERVEKYRTAGPDGKLVSVTHNIDTGETSVG